MIIKYVGRCSSAVGLSGIPLSLVLAGCATTQGLGLPSAVPTQVVDAAKECVSIRDSDGANPPQFAAGEWESATVTEDGKAPSMPMGVFRRGNVLAAIIVPKPDATPTCTITAQLASAGDYAVLKNAMAAEFGTPTPDDGEEAATFMKAGKVIQLSATGSKKAPVARIFVKFAPQEK